MTKYRLSPSAREDIEAIASYIAADSPEAAARFVEACTETFAWLAGMPRVGRPWESGRARLRTVRVWRVLGFPNYLVFYRPRRNFVLILHVVSGARDMERLFLP